MMAIQQCTNLIQGKTTEDCNGAIRKLKHIVDVATTAYKDSTLDKINEVDQKIRGWQAHQFILSIKIPT